jgi:uncharacterized protein YjiS (DUF1127 family)
MSSRTIDIAVGRAVAASDAHGRRIRVLWARLRLVPAIWRERRALARLTDDELLDVGLTRQQALVESRRRLLDLPAVRVGGID